MAAAPALDAAFDGSPAPPAGTQAAAGGTSARTRARLAPPAAAVQAAPAAAGGPRVAPVRPSRLEDIADAGLREALKERGIRPVDLSAHPELSVFHRGLAALLEKLLIPQDGDHTFHLVLDDSLELEANTQELPGGDRVIVITLGLIRFLQNDDELAFLLGHELERGLSKIQGQADDRGRTSYYLSILLQRAVQNEVDIQSMLRRLHEKGFNPHAGARFLDRLIAAYGDTADAERTLSSSRRDSLGAALTIFKRQYGKQVKEDDPSQYSDSLVGRFKRAFLDAPDFETGRRRLVQAALDRPLEGLEETYRSAREGKGKLRDYEGVYAEAFTTRWTEVLRAAESFLSPEERMDLQLELHRRLDARFSAARAAVFGPRFSTGDPRALALVRALEFGGGYELENVDLSRDNPLLLSRVDLERAKKERAERLAELSGTRDPERREELSSLLKEDDKSVAKYERKHRLTRHAYVHPDLEAKEARLYELFELSTREQLTGARAQEYALLDREVADSLRVIALLRRDAAQRERGMVRDHADLLLDSAKSIKEFEANLWTLKRHAPDLLRERRERAFEAYLSMFEAAVRRLRAAGDSPRRQFEFGSSFWRAVNPGPLRELLDELAAEDPAAAIRIVRSIFTTFVRNARELGEILFVFGGLTEGEPHFDGDILNGFTFSLPLARRVLDSQALDAYLKRLFAFTRAALHPGMTFPQTVETMDVYFSRVETLRQAGLIPGDGDLAGSVRRQSESLLRAGTAAAHRELVQNGFPRLEESRVRSLLLGRSPRWLDALGIAAPLEKAAIRADLVWLTRQRGLSRALGRPLDYFTLVDLFPRSAASAGWSLPEDREAFFRFVVDVEPMVDVPRDSAPEADVKAVLEASRGFLGWLTRNAPERARLMSGLANPDLAWNWAFHQRDPSPLKDDLEAFRGVYRKYFRWSWDRLMARHSGLRYSEQVERSVHDFFEGLSWDGNSLTNGQSLEGRKLLTQALFPENPGERVLFFNAFIRGRKRLLGPQAQPGDIAGDADMDSLFALIKRPDVLSVVSKDALWEAWGNLVVYAEKSPLTDTLFEKLWAASESDPDFRRNFLDPALVGKLRFAENQKKLALWQLDSTFNVESAARALRSGRAPAPAKGSLRPETPRMRDFIRLQVPERSALRNEIIDHVENKLLTNKEETLFFDEDKATLKNYWQHDGIAAVDLPHAANQAAPSNYERLKFLRYLLGVSEELPAEAMVPYDLAQLLSPREAFSFMRRYFRQADPFVRAWALQPLLDARDGILAEASMRRQVVDIVLGRHAGEPVYRALFEAYMEGLDEDERKVVLGYILAAFVDAPSGEKGASVKTVLEAMGPFGIKAGQFLRSTGMVGPELRRELDGFFSNALPPSRGEVFERLSEVFGETLEHVAAVLQVVGSGSVNIVVLVDLEDPRTGAVRRAVVRYLRDGVEGRSANENRTWERAIAKLLADPDPAVRRLGPLADEVRAHAFSHLRKGGSELSLGLERSRFQEARAIYRKEGRATRSGFSIDAGEPLWGLQELVPPDLQDVVSVYEFIPGVEIADIPDARLRAALAEDIVVDELDALFVKGRFDPDGHPGNWLIDPDGKRLRRIDYAQLDGISPTERDALREALAALALPYPDRAAAGVVAERFPLLFESRAGLADLESAVADILTAPGLPAADLPHERMFFLRQKLEERYAGGNSKPDAAIRLKPAARSALASLSRVNIYREHIGGVRFSRILAGYLGLSTRRYLSNRLMGELRRMTGRRL